MVPVLNHHQPLSHSFSKESCVAPGQRSRPWLRNVKTQGKKGPWPSSLRRSLESSNPLAFPYPVRTRMEGGLPSCSSVLASWGWVWTMIQNQSAEGLDCVAPCAVLDKVQSHPSYCKREVPLLESDFRHQIHKGCRVRRGKSPALFFSFLFKEPRFLQAYVTLSGMG